MSHKNQLMEYENGKSGRPSTTNNKNFGTSRTQASTTQLEEYKSMKKGAEEASSFLENAGNTLVSAMESLEQLAGKQIDSFKKKMENLLEEINETGERLNAIKENAIRKEIEMGEMQDSTDNKKYLRIDPLTNTIDTGIYRCDTYVLSNVILPLLDKINNDLEDAKNTTSKLPKNLQGCEDASSVQSKIDKTKKNSKELRENIEEEIEIAEKRENLNKALLDSLLNPAINPDMPAIQCDQKVAADIANLGTGFLKGFAKVGESLFDAVLIFCTMAADSGTMVSGEFVPYQPGTRGVSEEAWKDVMGFVADDHVGSAYKDFYANTDAGKWLNDNAHEGFKSEQTACEIASGLGEVVAITTLTVVTGGTSTIATSATAGLSATGKYTEEYWSNARDAAPEGADWATEEIRTKGIKYGVASGAWEATQWYVGGELNNLNINASSTVTSVVRVGIDTGFNALDTSFRASIDAATSDKTLKQAWEDQGGWTSVITNVGVGLIGSVAGEVIESKKVDIPENVNVTPKMGNVMDSEHGFQLNVEDLGDFYKAKHKSGFFSDEQIDNMLNSVNSKGYMDEETGEFLKSLFEDNDCKIYIKTIDSSDADSIMQEGIRCLGTTTSGYGTIPKNIMDINLDNTVTDVTDGGLLELIQRLKGANGISQGGNLIDGAMIIKVPKDIPYEDIFKYNDALDLYNIDPKYNVGFVGCDKGVLDGSKLNITKNLDNIFEIVDIEDRVIKTSKIKTSQVKKELNSIPTFGEMKTGVADNFKEQIIRDIKDGVVDVENIRLRKQEDLIQEFNKRYPHTLVDGKRKLEDNLQIAEYFNDPYNFLIVKLNTKYRKENADFIKIKELAKDDIDNLILEYYSKMDIDDKNTFVRLFANKRVFSEEEQQLLFSFSYVTGPAYSAYSRRSTIDFLGMKMVGSDINVCEDYVRRGNFAAGVNISNDLRENMTKFDKIIENTPPLTEDIIISRNVADIYKNGDRICTYEPGVIFNDRAMLSTSVNKGTAFSDRKIKLEIEVPKGERAPYIQTEVAYKRGFRNGMGYSQQEIILGRNNSYEIVDAMRYDPKNNQIIISAKLVSKEKSIIKQIGAEELTKKNIATKYYKNSQVKTTSKQVDLFEVMEEAKANGILAKYETEIRDLRNSGAYANKNRLPEHGSEHVEDVLFWAMDIGKKEGISSGEMELLVEAAKFHDCARESVGAVHGFNSATDFDINYGYNLNDRESSIVKSMIEYHAIPDNPDELTKIFNKYGVPIEDRASAEKLALILKDADALDRTRFPGNLDERYLRTDSSKKLIEASYQVQELRGTKYLNETNLDDRDRMVIKELREEGVSDYELAFWIKNSPSEIGGVMPVWAELNYKLMGIINSKD